MRSSSTPLAGPNLACTQAISATSNLSSARAAGISPAITTGHCTSARLRMRESPALSFSCFSRADEANTPPSNKEETVSSTCCRGCMSGISVAAVKISNPSKRIVPANCRVVAATRTRVSITGVITAIWGSVAS